jgi:hypothetical protein
MTTKNILILLNNRLVEPYFSKNLAFPVKKSGLFITNKTRKLDSRLAQAPAYSKEMLFANPLQASL